MLNRINFIIKLLKIPNKSNVLLTKAAKKKVIMEADKVDMVRTCQ